MTRQRILIVDDEAPVREVLTLYLQREGFDVATASDGEAALLTAQKNPPDLVVLDLMLPKISGMEVFRHLRETSTVPVIMLTARNDEIDRIVGLELGADDYVVKPFSPREVAARVKNVLRRASTASTITHAEEKSSASAIRVDDIVISPGTYTATVRGEDAALTSTEFELLHFLARHPGQVFSRSQLLDQVWGYDFPADASTVTVHIHRLREKIEENPAQPRYILTVWGVGYRFTDRVQ